MCGFHTTVLSGTDIFIGFDHAAFASYTHIIRDQACSAPDTTLTPATTSPESPPVGSGKGLTRNLSKSSTSQTRGIVFFCPLCHWH